MKVACFLCIAGVQYGNGHLQRCISIAEEMILLGNTVEFLIIGDQRALNFLKDKGYKGCLINLDEIPEKKNYEYFFIDIASNNFYIPESEILQLVNNIKKISNTTCLIDSMGKESIFNNSLLIDYLILPYEVSQPDIIPQVISGAKYACLGPSFKPNLFPLKSKKKSNIMVTCGGSDPNHITLKILQAIEMSYQKSVSVEVVIGPYFKENLIRKLIKITRSSQNKYKFIYSPSNLYCIMKKARLAISTSGLTKYELAASGTPSILLPISKEHQIFNEKFKKRKTAICLGYKSSVHVLIQKIRKNLHNEKRLRRMEINGKKLVDGLGARRISKIVCGNINGDRNENAW
jgi:spore coat polysaccharide biosynthesis predicted glycosyltransferase SpsG